MLRRPVTLEDRYFNMVAFGSHGEVVDLVRQDSILRRRSPEHVRTWFEQFGIADSDDPVRTPASGDDSIRPRLCLPARYEGVTYGYLWLIDEHGNLDEELMPAAMALASRAGVLMAQRARARDNLEWHARDLLSQDAELVEYAAQEVDRMGIIRRGTPVVAVEMQLTDTSDSDVPVNLWSLPRRVLTVSEAGRTTLLVPAPGRELGVATDVANQARDLYVERVDPEQHGSILVGIGSPRDDIAEVRASWQEARLAVTVCRSVPALRPVATWSELGVYRLLACGPGPALAGAVLDDGVVRLLDLGDPDLIDTAAAYLMRGGNVVQTAAELRVHRQTVYYRLQRIEQITGLDLAAGDQRLTLHLGLILGPLLRQPTGEEP